MKIPYIPLPVRLSLFFVVAVLIADAALAAEFQRTFSFDSKEMKVDNMIGQVQVMQASGDDFKVTVNVRGKDASEELLEFMVKEGSKGQLAVAFPTEDHSKYVYPPLGRDSKATFHYRIEDPQEKSWLKKVFHGMSGKKITVRGSGSGLEMWADLIIEVPRGRILHMDQGIGGIEAADLEGELVLDTSSGPIKALNIVGDFYADTGSGSVVAEKIAGDVFVDTGSGKVTVNGAKASKVTIDTGSGGVEAKNVRCQEFNVDTGSGGVTAESIAADQAVIDTGSGSVYVQLGHMGPGEFNIDTGSGGITLVLPENPSAHITAETGSGGIHQELSGAMVKIQERDELDITVGEGEARVILDAGSGSITIK